jgi:hypothetical protein
LGTIQNIPSSKSDPGSIWLSKLITFSFINPLDELTCRGMGDLLTCLIRGDLTPDLVDGLNFMFYVVGDDSTHQSEHGSKRLGWSCGSFSSTTFGALHAVIVFGGVCGDLNVVNEKW